MRLLGAEVRPVEFGTRTLKEATSEAIRDWITNVETTHYLIGSAVGPHPYPTIVRELTRCEGIIPALEPAHALARARELDETHVLVCLSGRGDKDLEEVLAHGDA